LPQTSYRFGDFELNCARFELRRKGRSIKLERIPMGLLILLAERDGDVVSRQEIVERLWGKDVFVDTEHGINTAIRKIRTALGEESTRRFWCFCKTNRSSTSSTPTLAIKPSFRKWD
jgi:DNA-binding winged helix-turn-helix (wHTH) protein